MRYNSLHKLCGSGFIFKVVTLLGSAAVLKIKKYKYDGGQHWLENPSFWVRTEVLLENRNRCFILEDTSQTFMEQYVLSILARGHLHDGVILLLRPESFSFFLSNLNLVIPARLK